MASDAGADYVLNHGLKHLSCLKILCVSSSFSKFWHEGGGIEPRLHVRNKVMTVLASEPEHTGWDLNYLRPSSNYG